MGVGGIIGSMGAISYDIVSQDKTKEGISSAKGGFEELAVTAGVVVAAMAAVGYAMKELSGAAGEYAHDIEDLNIITGIQTNQLEEWRYIAAASGADFNSLTTAIIFMQRNLVDVGKNAEKTEAFDKLGISVRDSAGNFKSMNELFPLIIQRLSEVENPADRAGIATAIFGRNIKDVMKIAGEGADSLADLKDEAYDAGVVMGTDGVANAAAYRNEMAKLNQQWEAMYREIGVELMPTMRGMMPFIREDVIPGIRLLGSTIHEVSKGLLVLGAGYKLLKGDMGGYYAAVLELHRIYAQDEIDKAQEVRDANAERSKAIQDSLDTENKAWEENAKAIDDEAIKKQTDATNDYLKALEDVNKEQNKLADITLDYNEKVMSAGRDQGEKIRLTREYTHDIREQREQIGVATGKAQVAGAGMVAAGGTPTSFTIAIENVNLSKDYPADQMMADMNRYLDTQRRQAGVRSI
jgi:TP901 family phage tail tape measure protein